MSEARSFIPIGSCVEDAAAYFDVPGAESMAQQACRGCSQLEQCTSEQEIIGALLVKNGSLSPVVAARRAALSPQRTRELASQHQTFGEVTLGSFDVVPLPSDGQRALRGIQRAVRLGVITRYGDATHPTEDMDAYYQSVLADIDPENAAYAEEAPLSLRYAVSALLWVSAERAANGALRRPHLRYRSFEPGRHVQYISAFMSEARQIKALGLPQHEAKLTLFHSLNYYQRYLEAGKAQGITEPRLGQALTKSPRDPMPIARQLKARQAQNMRRTQARQQKIPELPQSVHDVIIEKALHPEKILADVQQFRKYNILAIDPQDGKLILHESLAYLHKSEQRAILQALEVPGVKTPCDADEAVDLALVSSVLLPHLKTIRGATELLPGMRAERALAVLRRDIWGGQTSTNNAANLPEMLPTSYFASVVAAAEIPDLTEEDTVQAVEGLQKLFAAAVRYHQKHHTKLSIGDFTNIGSAYVQDWRRIQCAGQTKANLVALYYSADTHAAMVAYLTSDESVSQGMANSALANPVRAPLRPIRVRQRCFAEIKALPEADQLTEGVINNLASRGLDSMSAPAVIAAMQAAEQQYAGILERRTVQRIYTLYKLADAPDLLGEKAQVATTYREQYGESAGFWAIYDAIDRAKIGEEVARAQAVVEKIETVRQKLSQMEAREIDDFVITHIAYREGGNTKWLDGYYARLEQVDALPFASEFTDTARHKIATVSDDAEVVSNAEFFYRRLTRALEMGLTKEVMDRRLSYDLGWLNIPIWKP